jgi:hypothetical protein
MMLAESVSLAADDPIDSRSFLRQLKGEKGYPRDWVMCHLQPYWNARQGSQYRNGTFHHVPRELREKENLAAGQAGVIGEDTRQRLQEVVDAAPPAPTKKGGKNAKAHAVYSSWKDSANIND